MKLVTYRTISSTEPMFGAIITETSVVSFSTIMKKRNTYVNSLENMDKYLRHLPESQSIANEMLLYVVKHLDQFSENEIYPIAAIKLLPPISNVPALLDFGLSPRHLKNAAINIIQRECKWPLNALLKPFISRKLRREYKQPNFRYYKCNHNAIIGDGDTIHWPSYTSYLDIEPELGIVVGKENCIAGYVIFNDSSARDVQLPEFLGLAGPARCKDFNESKGIGPYLVTPDEIENPLELNVEVRIGERLHWKGSTSEYTAHPGKVLEEVCSIFTPRPGTIIGMGTIPDCCAIETEEWLLPSDRIEITIDKLGTLTQLVPAHFEIKGQSRWRERLDLPHTSITRAR